MQVPDVGAAPATQDPSSSDKPEQRQPSSQPAATSGTTGPQPSDSASGTARLELAQYGSFWRAQLSDGLQPNGGGNGTALTGSLISGATQGSLAARTEIA